MDPAALAELLDISVEQIDPDYPPAAAAAAAGTVDETDLARRLSIACERGHIDIVRLMLHSGATANGVNTRGLTPLFTACAHGHAATVQLLLESLAEPSLSCSDGTARTPLHSAAKRGDEAIARLLLGARADIHARARHRKALPPEPAILLTPLHLAALSAQSGIVSLLLEPTPSGASASEVTPIAAPSEVGTPLHCAAQSGDLASARLLLEHGASVDTVDAIQPRSLSTGKQVRRGPPLLCALLGSGRAGLGSGSGGSYGGGGGSSSSTVGSHGGGRSSAGGSGEKPQLAPELLPKLHAMASLLIGARASLDGRCVVSSAPAEPQSACAICAAGRELGGGGGGGRGGGGGGSGGGCGSRRCSGGGKGECSGVEGGAGGTSCSLLEVCTMAGARAAAAFLTDALHVRAEAAMRELVLEEADGEGGEGGEGEGGKSGAEKRAARKQRNRSSRAAAVLMPSPSGAAGCGACGDACSAAAATPPRLEAPAAASSRSAWPAGTHTPSALHAVVAGRLAETVTHGGGLAGPREALAERARRRALERGAAAAD